MGALTPSPCLSLLFPEQRAVWPSVIQCGPLLYLIEQFPDHPSPTPENYNYDSVATAEETWL